MNNKNMHIKSNCIEMSVDDKTNTFSLTCATVGKPIDGRNINVTPEVLESNVGQSVALYVNHDKDPAKQAGTANITKFENNKLYAEGSFSSTSFGQDIRRTILENENNNIKTGVSVGFNPFSTEVDKHGNLLKGNIYEISFVHQPALEKSQVNEAFSVSEKANDAENIEFNSNNIKGNEMEEKIVKHTAEAVESVVTSKLDEFQAKATAEKNEEVNKRLEIIEGEFSTINEDIKKITTSFSENVDMSVTPQEKAEEGLFNVMSSYLMPAPNESAKDIAHEYNVKNAVEFRTTRTDIAELGGINLPKAIRKSARDAIFSENLLQYVSTMSAQKDTTFPMRTGSMQVFNRAEGKPTQKTDGKFRDVKVSLEAKSTAIDVTAEYLKWVESAGEFTRNFIEQVGIAYNNKMSYEILHGTGEKGEYRGILNHDDLISQEAKETAISIDDFIKLIGKPEIMANRTSSNVFISTATETLLRTLKDSNGQYQMAFDKDGFISIQGVKLIPIGRVSMNDEDKQLLAEPDDSGAFASGSTIAIYGDLKKAYTVAMDSGAMTVEKDPYSQMSSRVITTYTHTYSMGALLYPNLIGLLKAK